MRDFIRDVAQAARALRRAPGFGILTTLVLALGIGATTSIFTLLQRIILDPLPYPASDRLVRLKNPVPGLGDGAEWQLSPAQIEYFSANALTLDRIGAYRSGGVNVATPEGAQHAIAAVVTSPAMQLLGARAVLGRTIGEGDDNSDAPLVVLLSHGFWQRAFGGDPAVLGRVLELNERPHEIVVWGAPPPGVCARTQKHNRAGPALAVWGAPPPGVCARTQKHNRAGPARIHAPARLCFHRVVRRRTTSHAPVASSGGTSTNNRSAAPTVHGVVGIAR